MSNSINSPQLIWINGRCHRINPTTDKADVVIDQMESVGSQLGAYEEPDLYGEDDREFSDIELVNNKFISSFPVPSSLHSRIIGPKNSVRKRVEHETSCQINIPRMGMDGPVEVVGLTRDNVISCRLRIDTILSAARRKMRPTHFIGVPFNSPALSTKFEEFTNAIGKFAIGGLTSDMITVPSKLHVTFNTMALLDDCDRLRASQLLKDFSESIINRSDRFKNIPVSISGLNSFQRNSLNKCRVLYAEVHSAQLQELGDAIYSHFIENNLSFEEFGRKTIAMHMTLIKGAKGNTFDCEQLFNELRDFDFGTVTVSELHLSQMSTVDPSTGYYKATTIIPLE